MLPVPVVANMKLDAKKLRKSNNALIKKHISSINRLPIVLVLDNILDTYNIGSFFRLADAISAVHVYLCGPVVTPPNIKIHRSSVGTWKWVPWTHYQDSYQCVSDLKKQGYQIVSCELGKNSIPYNKAKYTPPLALVAGSESTGVSNHILKISDITVEIPMLGINKSLNTLIATSIIAYQAISQIN